MVFSFQLTTCAFLAFDNILQKQKKKKEKEKQIVDINVFNNFLWFLMNEWANNDRRNPKKKREGYFERKLKWEKKKRVVVVVDLLLSIDASSSVDQ